MSGLVQMLAYKIPPTNWRYGSVVVGSNSANLKVSKTFVSTGVVVKYVCLSDLLWVKFMPQLLNVSWLSKSAKS